MFKLTSAEQQFVKQNREILTGIFTKRIDELKDKMILEEDEKARGRMRELALELKYWLIDIKILTREKKVAKKDNFI